MQLSSKSTRKNKNENLPPEEILKIAELKLETAAFELRRINELINRKSFVKRVQKDSEKLMRAAKRQRRAEQKVDQYQNLISEIKMKLQEQEKQAEKSA